MNKDIIYREDAIKAINLRARIPHDIASAHYANMAINAICSVPSADRPQEEWHNGFYDFLWNVINPNEMQEYIEIYEAQPIAVDGAQMEREGE